MVNKNAAEDAIDISTDITVGNIEDHIAYIKKVEWEFIDGIDELLETFNLSHLRVRSGEDAV